MLTMSLVPTDTVESMLREHLADPSARLTDLDAEPISSDGYSGNHLFQLRLAWTGARSADGPRSATWLLKRWLPGGHSEHLLGIHRPLEALGWRHGLLRPEALPPGVSSPIVSARLDLDGRAAWIAMEDVAPALAQYSRDVPLHHAVAMARVRLILDRLARFHTRWERPEQQAMLRRTPWLVPMERYLWCHAARYSAVLGKTSPSGIPPGYEVTDEHRANVAAILAWLPAGERSWFERLLCDREPLVSALRTLPPTLLHGDVDDRNLGLRHAATAHPRDDAADLILIDWEWLGIGTPALDVARLWASFPVVHTRTEPFPDAVFSDELPAYYFERYRAYGGALQDAHTWQRACAQAVLGLTMSQLDFIGEMIRHDVKPVVAVLARQFDTLAAAARTLPAN